jgi:hypothetical protein
MSAVPPWLCDTRRRATPLCFTAGADGPYPSGSTEHLRVPFFRKLGGDSPVKVVAPTLERCQPVAGRNDRNLAECRPENGPRVDTRRTEANQSPTLGSQP